MDGKGVVWWQQVTQKADVLDSREGQNIRLPEIAIPALEPGYLPTSRSRFFGKKFDHVPPFPMHTYYVINGTLSTQLLIKNLSWRAATATARMPKAGKHSIKQIKRSSQPRFLVS